jgi:hypothetical protein
MKREILNNNLGAPYVFGYPKLSLEQENQILATLFEQLLIFDKVTLSTNRLNFALAFLINKLGINTVEKLIDHRLIDIMIWTPMIFTGGGRKRNDGTLDESVIYGQPPITAGTLSNEDLDPELNISRALNNFGLHRDRKRIFTQKAVKNYVIPNGMEFSSDSAKFIIEAYKSDSLRSLGLPFEKEPNQLTRDERGKLLSLGHKVLETALLSKYDLKSYDNYEHIQIYGKNLEKIGKAYNISENTSSLLNLEGLPNLKKLYIEEHLDFDSIFKLRHLSSAKYYRKWINEVGENSNSTEVTKEYLNQIKGNGKFFESTKGKFVRNLGLFGINTYLSAAITGPVLAAGVGYVLGLLETYCLDNLLKGKNPSMFIDDIKIMKENKRTWE